ncbi:MAG: phosphoribosylamine--glycine ligase [Bacteroidales bacterium]|nr:phosphoribosylamine--glycine ligase [Bacteroidales bacterium]
MNILLLGSGGREHAMAAKIAESPQCDKLYIAPGNAGTSQCGTNVALDNNDFEAIRKFVLDNGVGMVVVGPEAPLVAGLQDFFARDEALKKIAFIGPSRQGATLEGSKDFAKAFMQRHGIPTAAYRSFTRETLPEGIAFLHTLKPPYVLKADGLAAGKGVLIIDDLETAENELHNMLENAKFGAASDKVVIEEFLHGIELSVFVLTDGEHYIILPSAKDYKRIGEGDTGLNTGGMGSVSPVPFADKAFMQKVEERIVRPTVNGIREEKISYKGFIFLGLMNCGGDPYVIEYNVRMGDPETESVFPRISSDMVELFNHTWNGTLDRATLKTNPQTAACVMMVAGGYPGSYPKGNIIQGVENVKGSLVFHAGTKRDANGQLLTNGGRVLCVTSFADNLEAALAKSYAAVNEISWEGCHYRRDIGRDLM